MATAKLLSTKDYSKFELCQFNRSVVKKKNLLASMKLHGYIPAYPIHCNKGFNGTFQIKAGHHRFECAQELGLPIFYVVADDSATIHELEKATTQWTLHDYLNSYVRCGLPAYATVKAYYEETRIPLSVCISVLGGETASSHNLIDVFKEGHFEINGEEHADMLRDIVLHCQSAGICTDHMFVNAVSRCLRVELFSPEVFKLRAATNATMMHRCRTMVDQMKLFEEVYNFKALSKNRLPLCFLADQAMMQRSPLFKKKVKRTDAA